MSLPATHLPPVGRTHRGVFRPAPAELRWPALLLGAVLGTGTSLGHAATVSVNTPFINLEHRAVNSIGAATGQFLRIGAVSVVPNGANGTTGIGTHVMPDGSTITRTINSASSPLLPNFFSRLLQDSPDLRGDWDLTFRNGGDQTTRRVSLSPSAQQAPFVNSITLSGTSQNPTFSWTPPPGVRVDAYRINIYDKDLVALGQGGQVTNRDLLPGQTAYTVAAADFTVPGYAFTLGKPYAIEFSLIQTKDGTSRSSNDNLQAIARVYADFTASNSGGPAVNLPVVLANGSYQFNMTVVPGQTYYIDPEVAIGYDYAIGAGNPNFASVALPAGIGDGLYDIYGFDALNQLVLLADDWQAGQVFDFGTSGVDRFRVLGIETAAMLDPANTTAFVTALTFTAAGQFTGTQTPITVDLGSGTVPEPAAWMLTPLALGLAMRRPRRSGA